MAAETLVLLSRSYTPQINPLAYNSETEGGPSLFSEPEEVAEYAPSANQCLNPSISYDDMGDSQDEIGLSAMEADIDLKILNHVSGEDLELRQKKFRKTVSAIQIIVGKKLYKEKAVSLENYFRECWKISRAQVYRFLDCASVLAQLEGFTRIPTRERLCRTLKCLAKTKCDLRILWAASLCQLRGNPDAITSTSLTQLWSDLLEERKVSGFAEGMLAPPSGFTEEAWEQQIESTVIEYAGEWMNSLPKTLTPVLSSCHSIDAPTQELPAPASAPKPQTPAWNTFEAKHRAPIFSSIESLLESSDVETPPVFSNDELTLTSQVLSQIDSRKHHLEYFSDGEWKQAKSLYWRISSNYEESESTPIMLTSIPPPPPPKTSTTTTAAASIMNLKAPSKHPKQKSIRSKIAAPASAKAAYDSTAMESSSGTDYPTSKPAVPVAAEPPRLCYGGKRQKKSKTERSFDAVEISDEEDESYNDFDCSSDYHDEGGLFGGTGSVAVASGGSATGNLGGSGRRQSKTRTKKRPRHSKTPGSSDNGEAVRSTGTTEKPDSRGLEAVSDAIAEEMADACWSDFAPEELEAVAVLQKYRFERQSVSPNALQQVNRTQSQNFEEDVVVAAAKQESLGKSC
ncbi:hypothetical protein BDR26DRAFT_921374 [Obelidium mucronatum]|nr:hypothetical protein BDR26DRAFT_921374 [Obelidium mucronatum]